MKVFNMYREGYKAVVTVTEDGKTKPLPVCLDVRNHSPDGFEWGYHGSGPSQLALAIMCELFGKDLKEHPIDYHDLKNEVIATMDDDGWAVSEAGIHHRIDMIRRSK